MHGGLASLTRLSNYQLSISGTDTTRHSAPKLSFDADPNSFAGDFAQRCVLRRVVMVVG